MRRVIGEFLHLLCKSCGAEHARIRISFQDKDTSLIVLDREADGGITRHDSNPTVQLSLLESLDPGYEAGVPASEAPPPVSGAMNAGEWELIGPNGLPQWRFRGSMNGFRIELELDLPERTDGFINDRLTWAGSFLEFLESLLGAHRASLPAPPRTRAVTAPFNPPLLGDTPQMLELKRVVRKVAAGDVSILLEGESGTGKEVVAQNIHWLSPRRGRPLVVASCLEMPHTLLQSEFFGHTEGAFTGASRERAGLVESANGGTFFLDEIGEMPLSLQAALLRVLQEKEIRRIGESRRRKIDVRFIFATNRELRELVRRERFREDLYFRISGVRLHLPPLRRRKEDVVMLANHFLEGCCAQDDSPALTFGAMRRMLAYHWPGNVRELKNEMERIVALHGGERIVTPEMLSPHIGETCDGGGGVFGAGEGGLPGAVQALEGRMIRSALEQFSGNRTRSAEALGITRQGLLKKMKRYGITGGDERGMRKRWPPAKSDVV